MQSSANTLALSLTILCLSCIQTLKHTSSSCTFAMSSPPFSSFPHFNHILTALPRPKVMTVTFSWNQSTSIETLSSWSALTSITSVNVFGDQSQHPNVWEKANIDGLMQRKCMGMMCLHVSCNRQHSFCHATCFMGYHIPRYGCIRLLTCAMYILALVSTSYM